MYEYIKSKLIEIIYSQNAKSRRFGPPPAAPLMGWGGFFFLFDAFLSEFFKNINFFKIGPQLFDL